MTLKQKNRTPLKVRFRCIFGRGRIRTHGPRKGTAVFKTAALGHSATLP